MQEIKYLDKTIGFIRANNETPPTYITERNKTKHYFRKYEGYGMSTKILRLLKDSNVQNIIIIEETENEEKRKLTTTVNTYYEHGQYHTYKEADHQLILNIKYFKTE